MARYPVRDGDTCLYIDRCDEKRIVPKVDQSYGMRKSPLCARNAIKVRQKYNMAENYLKGRWEWQEQPEVRYPQAVGNCALKWKWDGYSKCSAVLNNEGRGSTRLHPSVRPSHAHTSSRTVVGVLGRWALRPGTCKTPPSSPRRSHRLCGPSSLQHTAYQGLLTSGIKRTGRQVDLSLQFSV